MAAGRGDDGSGYGADLVLAAALVVPGEPLETCLFSGAQTTAVPGPKTDARDAEWIAQLLERRLLRRSLVPPPDVPRVRIPSALRPDWRRVDKVM